MMKLDADTKLQHANRSLFELRIDTDRENDARFHLANYLAHLISVPDHLLSQNADVRGYRRWHKARVRALFSDADLLFLRRARNEEIHRRPMRAGPAGIASTYTIPAGSPSVSEVRTLEHFGRPVGVSPIGTVRLPNRPLQPGDVFHTYAWEFSSTGRDVVDLSVKAFREVSRLVEEARTWLTAAAANAGDEDHEPILPWNLFL